MVNKIWGFFIVVGILLGIINGKTSVINENILLSTTTTIEMILKIFPVIALWLGIMEIAKESGLLIKLSNIFKPILSKLFPELPSNHEALGYISSNVVINMLGLGNAATPFGLKAMNALQKDNKDKKQYEVTEQKTKDNKFTYKYYKLDFEKYKLYVIYK